MTGRDILDLAARNLREALLRNSLTTLGIGVGVASLVAMLSLGVGLQTLASQRLERSGLFDAVFVTSRGEFTARGGPRGKNNAAPGETKPLDDDTIRQFQRLLHVTEVYPQIRFVAEVHYGDQTQRTSVMALPPSASKGGAFDGMHGKFFSSASADETILQSDFAKALNENTSDLIGKELTLRYTERAGAKSTAKNQADADEDELDAVFGGGISLSVHDKRLRIVGVTESDPSAGPGGFGGARVFVPLATAQAMRVAQPADLQGILASGHGDKPTYFALTIRTQSPKYVPDVELAVKGLGYSTFSLLDATRNLRLFFTVFDLLLGLFGSLALTVASLGIINTLVMAILERRREIGILKALGASDSDVQRLFFAEAGAMGVLGGLAGVAFGRLIGQGLSWGTAIYLRRQELPAVKISYVPWWLALGAIGFAIVVSLAAGIYPASRAAKLNPVEALRYE